MTSITKATGDYSISVGYGSSSTGHNGIALGFQSNETDDKSISIGYKADAGRIPGHLWNSPTSDDSSSWSSITYNTPTAGDLSGTPIFVAVSNTGTYSVMTSDNGITWTGRNTNGDGKTWKSVTAAVPSIGSLSGNMLFVAVGPPTSNSEGVIVSQDGINWTLKNTVINQWSSVTHGLLNGITTFVAVCNSGNNVNDNRVMTSQDANTWTIVSNTEFANDWRSVTSGIPSVGDASNNTLFVAVSFDSYVMTSIDSTTWVLENPATNSILATSVCVGTPHTGNYANQTLFVAVGHANSNQDVIMISNDGYTWTSKSAGSVGNGLNWESVTAGMVNGVTLFAAVSSSGTGNRVMTSYDGENWTVGSNTPDNSWKGIVSGIPSTGTYAGEEIFVAVSSDGSSSRVMTSNMMCKNSIAIGSDAITGGQNSIALGNGASTGQYHNSVAIGQGTTTGADDEIRLGTSTHRTYVDTLDIEKVEFNGYGNNYISIGNGDNATSSTANVEVKLWYGLRFIDYDDNCRTFLNARTGELTSSSFNATSDFRLKKDISNLSNVLENVCRLQGVEFVRKDDETQRKQLGFIAQDVEEIFPQLVQTEDSKEKYKSVSYANTCALLVEAVKEMRGEMTAENALLKTEIASLKTEIETMKSNK
jgi:hypothetical protein